MTDDPLERDQVWVLETNLDDIGGELIGHCCQLLMGAGALDVGGEDVAVFPKIEDGAAFDVGARALAGALIVVVEVGGEGGEGDFGVERSVGHEQAGNKERLHVEPRRVFAQM